MERRIISVSELNGVVKLLLDNEPLLRNLAVENGIPWQTKEYLSGGTDARTIQRTKEGVRVAAVSAAVRYLHAPASVGSLADFEDMLALTRLFVADQAARL